MIKTLVLSTALAVASFAAGTAQAAIVVYDVNANFAVGPTAAGTLTGSFSVDNVLNKVTALNLTSSGNTVGGLRTCRRSITMRRK